MRKKILGFVERKRRVVYEGVVSTAIKYGKPDSNFGACIQLESEF